MDRIKAKGILIALLLIFNSMMAQTTATTDLGRRIILSADGTWKYDRRDTTKRLTYDELAVKLAHMEKAATRQQFLALAMAMASKSRELTDPELQGLIALQAYQFHRRYDGYALNRTIYAAVSDAIETLKLTKNQNNLGKENQETTTAPGNKIPSLAAELGTLLTRNMTKDEWEMFVGGQPYESTCPNLPPNNQ